MSANLQPDCNGDPLVPRATRQVPKTSVTVAICTRDRAEQVSEALESLSRLRRSLDWTYDILVVDNGSRDQTRDVVEAFAARSAVPVHYVFEPRAGVAAARNRALACAGGAWIAFLDDDEQADPHWLAALLDCARRTGASAVGGAVQLELPFGTAADLGPYCRRLLGETAGHTTERPYDLRFQPGAGNLLLWRLALPTGEVFPSADGSSNGGRGEDTRWFVERQAASMPVWYAPQAIVRHLISADRLERAALVALSRDSGRAADITWRRWKGRLPWVLLARTIRFAATHLPRRVHAEVWGTNGSVLDEECRTAFELERILDELRFLVRRLENLWFRRRAPGQLEDG